MRAQEFQGINVEVEDGYDDITLWATTGGRKMGNAYFVKDGKTLLPQDLFIDERYRGQGIAGVLYDYAKSLGYEIRRSGQQTDAGAAFWNKNRPGQNVWEAQTRLPRAIEEFLDSLTPDDCGVEDIGAYRIHFEGFTSNCKSSSDYRRNPDAVYQQVYRDFIQREGGQRPIVQDMVGDEDFPVLYSIFRRRSVNENQEEYLYHATYRPLLKSIQARGLGNTTQSQWTDSQPGVVYLARDPEVARSYAEAAESVPEAWLDQIVVLQIPISNLDPKRLQIDQNVLDNTGDTMEYHAVIPASKLKTLNEQQPNQKQQATARQVLDYINRTHHEPFRPGEKMYKAVLAHPRWQLQRVPLLNLYIPDQEYDDVDYDEYEPEADPYGRVMTVEPGHAGEISQNLVDQYPIVIDANRYIIDGNHRAWAAKYLLNRDYIDAWVPV